MLQASTRVLLAGIWVKDASKISTNPVTDGPTLRSQAHTIAHSVQDMSVGVVLICYIFQVIALSYVIEKSNLRLLWSPYF